MSDGSGLECDGSRQPFYTREFGLSLKKQRGGIVKEKPREKAGCRSCHVQGMDAKAKTSSLRVCTDIFLVNGDIAQTHPENRDAYVGESR